MRGATQCARRLKALVSALKNKLGKVSPPAGGDPVTQMVLGILSRDAPESKAREALDRVRSMVVDYNELRVIPSIELAELLADYPDGRLKCEDISRSLNKVFSLHHSVTLAHLSGLSNKEVRAYLDKIDGLEAYTRARVRLLGLQQHAVPLDEAMWAYARQASVVDARCPLEEAQAFLERQIAPEDALEFVALLRRQAWSELGDAVRRREVPRIQSVPPDRTARNMLRLVGLATGEPALDPSELDGPEVAELHAAPSSPTEPGARGADHSAKAHAGATPRGPRTPRKDKLARARSNRASRPAPRSTRAAPRKRKPAAKSA